MGISLSQYRYAIGSFRALSRNSDKYFKSISEKYRFINKHNSNRVINNKNKFSEYNIIIIIYFIIVLYLYIFIELAAVSMPPSFHSKKIFVPNFYKTSLKANCIHFFSLMLIACSC